MKTSNLFLIIIIGIVFIMWLAEEEPPPKLYAPDSMDAYIMAKQFMTKGLKAPSTADFAPYSKSDVTRLRTGEWVIKSYVDSQNGFGAMIRTQFTMTMSVNRNTKVWQVINIKTEP